MSKNEIVKTEQELAEIELVDAAMLAEMQAEGDAWGEFRPENIRLASGGIVAFQTSDGAILPAPLVAIVAMAQKARAFWPSKDTAGLPPLCSSKDRIVGMFDVESPQVGDALRMEVRHPALDTTDKAKAAGPWVCASCPLAEYGSGPNGAQACKDMRKLLVVIRGWAKPAVLTLPPTSGSVWDKWVSTRHTQGHPYPSTWLKLGLVQTKNKGGTVYGLLTISIDESLDVALKAEIISVRRQYEDLVRNMGIEPDDYETTITADMAASSSDTELPPF